MKSYINLTFREFVEDKILYHGSDAIKFGDVNKNIGWFGLGFYLSSNLDYAKKQGSEIYLFKAPLDNCAEVSVFNHYKKIIFHGYANNANRIAGGSERWVLDENGWAKDFIKSLYSRGHDGIRLHIDKNKDAEVLIFNPKKLEIVGKM
jgi:hypothetical protein